MYTYIHVNIYTYLCIYIYIHIYIYTCIYTLFLLVSPFPGFWMGPGEPSGGREGVRGRVRAVLVWSWGVLGRSWGGSWGGLEGLSHSIFDRFVHGFWSPKGCFKTKGIWGFRKESEFCQNKSRSQVQKSSPEVQKSSPEVKYIRQHKTRSQEVKSRSHRGEILS